MYVFDATPLISLASTDRLDLVASLDDPRCMPESVYEEVVTAGIDAGHADARRIERAVEEGMLAVESDPDPDAALVERLSRADALSEADVAVLALADVRDGTAVMDEAYGRSVADTEGIHTRGTAFVVLRAQRHGAIGPDESRTAIDDLLDAGWYCAPDLYARILEKIEEIG